MRITCLLFAILFAGHNFGQCPFQVKVDSIGIGCLPNDTLVVRSSHPATSVTWLYNSIPATTVTATIVVKPLENATTVAGGNGLGSALNQLSGPSSLFIDAAGFLYVADRSNYRVVKFPPGSTNLTNGIVIAGGNGPGQALNQFRPGSICVDAGGNLYVADDAGSRVLKFPPGSSSATNGTVAAGGNGAGVAANQLTNAVSVFVDDNKSLYVVDGFNDRVQKFPPNSTSATNAVTLAGGNGAGSALNQFNGPASVFVDKDGYIYVDDAANNRVQKFPPNSTSATNGVTIAGGNGFGAAANQLSTPSSIWVDNDGNVYVADINNQRIQMFPPGSTSATLGKTVAGGNGQGTAANQFKGPSAVWGDNRGNLCIADIGNSRIQQFNIQPVKQYLIDSTFIARVSGTYAAVVTDTLGCTVTSNYVIVNPLVLPSVNIKPSSDIFVPCTQTTAIYNFTATPVNGGSSPIYQWQINGGNAGSNSPLFKADVTNGDVISCIVTSNAVCVVPATVAVNKITVSFAAKPAVSLRNTGGICAGRDTFLLTGSASSSTIVWYNNGMGDATVQARATPGGMKIDTFYKPPAAGSYYAVAINAYGCTDTSETMTAKELTVPQITIAADKIKGCEGDALTFTATAEDAGEMPVYQWLANEKTVGANRSVFTTYSLRDNDTVRCIVKGDPAACISNDTSNRIVSMIKPLPRFDTATDIVINLGQSAVLSVPVTGDIVTYAWQPSATLSNPAVATPVATPFRNTVYTLHVLSADSCSAVSSVTVVVSSPVLIPAAFSPNGDGRNDYWYVLSGKAGDIIKKISVFNRQGKVLFYDADIFFGDRKRGWNGMYKDILQSPGTYIYEVIIASADGHEQVYKGTVVLMR